MLLHCVDATGYRLAWRHELAGERALIRPIPPDGWTDVFNVSFQTTYAQPGGLVQGSLIFTPGADARGELVPLDNVTADFLLEGSLLDINFTVLDPNRFRYTLDGTAFMLPEDLVIPIPAAVWLFGSGLIGLIGLARRKANA
jgi:hypothetical protein